MRKPFITAATSLAILGWATGAQANPPAPPPADHADVHDQTKGDHHDDKDGKSHQPNEDGHHDSGHQAPPPHD